MSETHADPPAAGGTLPPRTKGQSLIAEYRRARIAARPALRTELRECRVELQQQRQGRHAAGGAQAAPLPLGSSPLASDAPGPVTEAASGGSAMASIFATYCVAMAAPVPADEPPVQDERESPGDREPEALSPMALQAPPAPAEPPSPEPTPPDTQVAEAAHAETPLPGLGPAAEPASAPPVPLSAIGFGPGMTIRLSQLGIENVEDLAAADARWLQTALGDLSDLVHAESWIAAARQACFHPA